MYEGAELFDGAAISDFYIQQLSTIRAVWSTAEGGGAAPGAAAASAAQAASAAPSEPSLLAEGEVSRAIIIRGIPAAEPAATEVRRSVLVCGCVPRSGPSPRSFVRSLAAAAGHLLRAAAGFPAQEAIFKAFSRFGEISRLICQDDAAGGAGGAPNRQHAVLVFYRDVSAAAALAGDGTLLLGAPIQVLLASNLVQGQAGGAARQDGGSSGVAGRVPLFTPQATAAVAQMIAMGSLYAQQGVAHVRRFDEESGLSRRVKVLINNTSSTAAAINQRYQVRDGGAASMGLRGAHGRSRTHPHPLSHPPLHPLSHTHTHQVIPTVRAGYDAAAAQARQLNATYGVTQKIDMGLAYALSKAAVLAGRAMENPTVASIVTSGKEFVHQALHAVDDTLRASRREAAALNPGGAQPAGQPSSGGASSPPSGGLVGLPPAFPTAAATGSGAEAAPQHVGAPNVAAAGVNTLI